MPAIWTDSDGRVSTIHYQPDNLSEADLEGYIEVTSVPSPDESVDGEPVLYYTETDGFWYEYQ